MKNFILVFILFYFLNFNPGFTQSGLDWNTLGNTSLTSGTNFLGTTDNTDLSFKTNSSVNAAVKMELEVNGFLGLGITTPQSLYHMHSGGANNFFQMTNAATGNGSNAEGFTIDVNNTTQAATLTQIENAPMQFDIWDQNLGQRVRRAEWTTGQAI